MSDLGCRFCSQYRGSTGQFAKSHTKRTKLKIMVMSLCECSDNPYDREVKK